METKAPTAVRILIATGFAISCFGLLLFLWISFGGPVPLKAEGYKVTVPFTEASQLAQGADVRVSGVSVGTISRVERIPGGEAEATLELNSDFAPIPSDTQAILRQKTLLGETYVELTPGSEEAEPLPENGSIPTAQVSDAVQLDEVFRTFDPKTQEAFRVWMQGQAAAWQGRGDDVSAALASLDPFAEEANRLLRLLDTQEEAVTKLVRDGGEVFGALVRAPRSAPGPDQEQQHRLRHHRPAQRGPGRGVHDLPDLPARVARDAYAPRGVRARHRPGCDRVAPGCSRAWADRHRARGPRAAPGGVLRRAAADHLSGAGGDEGDPPPPGRPPAAASRQPRRLARPGERDLRGRAALPRASSPAWRTWRRRARTSSSRSRPLRDAHYIRTESPLTPEAIAAYPQRLDVTRTNPYFKPGAFLDLVGGLESFETRHCTRDVDAQLDPATATDPIFQANTDGDAAEAQTFFDRLQRYRLQQRARHEPDHGRRAAMPQPPVDSVGSPGESSRYLHVRDLENP